MAAAELERYAAESAGCTRCRLAETRTQVVFGVGNPEADLMLVGEAPGFHEDKQGLPFVGQAGKLLDTLLAGIGLERSDVYIANVLKCLRYNTLVQLGDGSWERIGRLVRSRYRGTVMSVDFEGRLIARRVIGWHATPLAGRKVLRVTYRTAKRTGARRVCAQMTADHPVLTERGYVPVEALRKGDRIAIGQGLSDVAFDVVCGTVLGDGHLNAKSSHLFFAHSAKQTDYARFKSDLLAELDPAVSEVEIAAAVGGDERVTVTHVRTRAHRALRVLRHDFYEDRRRAPIWMAEKLNGRMLAIWFMDDGHMRIRPGGRQPLAEIATVAFSDGDRNVLRQGLLRLGLPSKILRGRIYFDVATTRKLSELIAPYVPPSMRYKLHPDVAERVLFDSARLQAGPPKVMYDEVEVEDVSQQARTDTTFFCIDVEETHNFVTSGGVVHNCRPPGNRDPNPDEIESCEPHLWKQIQLIQPKLIGTLGNFATKLLSGRPTGITRVHGSPQETTLGGRRVVLYPLYHPAAALYTPSMLQVLEEDFRRIPSLLGEATAPPEPPGPEPAVLAPEPTVQLDLF